MTEPAGSPTPSPDDRGARAPTTISIAGLGLEPPPPSIAPGPRRLLVPEGEIIRRVDRFVADRTGLSRSYVQKLISEGLLVDDTGRRLRANSEVRGGAVTLEVPPPEIPYHLEPDPTIEVPVAYEDDDLLIVNKPVGPRGPPGARPLAGHARQRAARPRRPLRRDRRGRAAGHRPPPRPRHVGPADRRPQRRRAGVASWPSSRRAASARRTSRWRRVRSGRPSGRIEAPIGRDPKDRKRMAVVPDGRSGDHRLSGPGAVPRLDAARAGPRHRVGPTRSASTSPRWGTRSPATRCTGPGTSRKGPDGLERLFLHAWRLELVSPSSARLIRVEAPLPDALETVLDGLRAAEASAGRRPMGGNQ